MQSPATTAEMRRARMLGRPGVPDMATMGEMRVARTAGTSEAIMVTPMPTISAIAIVRGANTKPVRGMPKPTASKSELRSLENPIPARIPRPEAITPIASASVTTIPSTWRRVAPSARTIANSRIRWATVIEKVLKMMKAPTSTAAPARASSAGVRNEPIWSLMSLACSVAFCWAVWTLGFPGRAASMRSARI